MLSVLIEGKLTDVVSSDVTIIFPVTLGVGGELGNQSVTDWHENISEVLWLSM